MPHIKPTRDQIKRLVEDTNDGPVYMLNLLRFAKTAGGDRSKSGADSYDTYGDQMRDIMSKRGIKLLWQGRADQVVIGDDEGDAWDQVLLVEYPNRKAFLEMASSQEYEKVGEHRTNALIDSRLIACTELFRLRS